MKNKSTIACAILEQLSNVDMWNIGIKEILHALAGGLESQQYAITKRTPGKKLIVISNSMTETKIQNILKKRKNVDFTLKIGEDIFRMHFFDIPRRMVTREEHDAIQVVLKMISKALQMRQVSKDRIIETQIINQLNLNVTTALDEHKIVTNLETAARKMLGIEQIYLFYIINDMAVGSSTSLRLSEIPKRIYDQLFRIQQIFSSRTDSSIFADGNKRTTKNTILTFIPFTIKNELRGFFVIYKDILKKNRTYGITRLRFLANQVALAIERIDLFRALNRALKESHGIQELVKIMLSSPDLSSLFNEILQRAQKILGFNRILFSLRDPRFNHFTRVTGVGISALKLKKARLIHPPYEAINSLFLNRFRISNSYYIPAREARKIKSKIHKYELYPPQQHGPRLSQVWDPGDIFISPVYSKSRELVAILSLDKPINNLVPTMEQVRLLETFGDFFGMAIENARLFERIENLSNTDEMTGILNYRFLREYIKKLIKDHRSPITLVFIDLDNFKAYNDRYGHLYGDEILKLFAQNLVTAIGKQGYVTRYGGDEFILVFPKMAIPRVRKILTSIERSMMKHAKLSQSAPVHFTFGVASFPRHGHNLGALIDYADSILYKKKSKKKR